MNDQVNETEERETIRIGVAGEGDANAQLFAGFVQTGSAQIAQTLEEISVVGGQILASISGYDTRAGQKEVIGSLFTSIAADVLAIAVASSSANLAHPVEELDKTLEGVFTVVRNNAKTYRARIEEMRAAAEATTGDNAPTEAQQHAEAGV